jgi:GT2 family glycosyltransferase
MLDGGHTGASEAGDAPSVAVVVLNWRDAASTIACLESLATQAGAAFEVVVVDNDSGDDSVATIEAFLRERASGPATVDEAGAHFGQVGTARAVHVLQAGANDGYSAGNNVGIQYGLARGAAHAWVLNNDVVVGPGALAAALDCMEAAPHVGAVGSVVLHAGTDDVQYWGGAAWSWWTGRSRAVHTAAEAGAIDYVAGCAMLLRGAALREVGGLGEGLFLYGEEIDLCERLAAAGWQLAVADGSVLEHAEGATTGAARSWRTTSTMSTYYAARNVVVLARCYRRRAVATAFGLRLAFALPLLVRSPRNAVALVRGAVAGLTFRRSRLVHPAIAERMPAHR